MSRVRPTFWKLQNGKLVQSNNVPVIFSGYSNFGTVGGDTGYGIRDNGGTMQFKNAAGVWTDFGSGGGGGGGSTWAVPAESPDGSITVFTFATVPKLIITNMGVSVNGNGCTVAGNVATMDFAPTFIYALIT